jgi:hypothetical protein
MIKVIDKNCIYLIGKIEDIKMQLASIENESMTLAEYIKQQNILLKNSLH